MFAFTTNSNFLRFFWRFALGLSICNVVLTRITKRCITIEEHLLKQMPWTPHCLHYPGKGPYANCNITDLSTDLSQVGFEVRTLCVFGDITSIPAKAFSHLPSLEVLHIDGIRLERVQAGAFEGLPNLKYLSMLFSDELYRLVRIDNRSFAGLNNLEELSLTGLMLLNGSSGIFDPLVSLIRLDIVRTCAQDLGEIFCCISNGMTRLRHLNVEDSEISTIENKGCPGGSMTWPLTALSGVQNLYLIGNNIKYIQANSLIIFQNLSSLFLEFEGKSLGSIWESGVGKVNDLTLKGKVLKKYSTNFKDLCHLVSSLYSQSLSLVYTSIDRLTAEDLKDCGTKLTKLLIQNSKIDNLDFRFWTSKLEMQALQMAYMKLTDAPFCFVANSTMWSLTSLDLTGNSITNIEGDQFACMPFLEQLYLSQNAIKTLQLHAFRGLPRLKILQLDSNKIWQLSANDFKNLRALEVLLINDNIIETIETGTFWDQRELCELSFGRLEYVYELHLENIFFEFPPKLQRLSIDAHYGTNIYIGNASPPNGTFALELNGERLGFVGCDSDVLMAVRELKVNCTYFLCKDSFMAPYFLNLESLEISGGAERAPLNYATINNLHHLKHLKLARLNFPNYTESRSAFWNLTQLQTLVVVNCHLSFLTKSMFRDLTSLQLLRLYSDSPLILTDGVFGVLPVLKAFILDRVDFQCSCENGWLLDWADSTEKVQVIYLQKQQCVWHYQKLNFLATMEKLCQTDAQYICYVATASSISLLLSAAVGYQFARWPSLVLFLRLKGWMERRFGRRWNRRRRRMEDDYGEIEEMQYDAFVSFCSQDEAWVLGEMASRLEEQGNPRLRLCLHNRDFEVGKDIMDNITDSIHNSQCTVCLISRRYLRSDWCGLEMRVATHRQLEEQKHRLILIFLQHISPFELSAFHRLAKLVRSRTYLDWPEEEGDREHFWDRLRRNIAEDSEAS
ncbi:toll-like receptor 19 [Danio rerio]|uniref:Toll-like receptor 19 n=1 Tax=Danio rerio TaxID=7955 RepID=A0AB13A3M3_DANRE|nr:toll-like receptor 19 [Danio rerio]|eukprot:XP_009290567.2 toll-like receptor 13 [Danio rerio]